MILLVKGIDKNMQIATVYELYLEESNGIIYQFYLLGPTHLAGMRHNVLEHTYSESYYKIYTGN
jgi:hypothetical protein